VVRAHVYCAHANQCNYSGLELHLVGGVTTSRDTERVDALLSTIRDDEAHDQAESADSKEGAHSGPNNEEASFEGDEDGETFFDEEDGAWRILPDSVITFLGRVAHLHESASRC